MDIKRRERLSDIGHSESSAEQCKQHAFRFVMTCIG